MATAPSPRRFASAEFLEIRRLLAAGALDTTFSGDGIAQAGPPGETFVAVDLCLQSDGKTVVVGNTSVSGTSLGGMAARYNVDGTLDTDFGVSGFSRLPVLEEARAVAMQGSSIIVVGDADGSLDLTHPAAARLTSAGMLDPTFGSNGFRIINVPGDRSHANDVIVQVDSKILIAGSSHIGEGPISAGDDDFIAIRLNSNGTTDTPFGAGDGVTQLDFTGARDEAWCVALDYTVPTSDPKYGSIFLAGFRLDVDETGTRYAVAKLTPAGIPDNSFDGNGLLTTVLPGGPRSMANDAVVQSGSRLVVTGVVLAEDSFSTALRNFATIRYLANGAIDTSFGSAGNGIVETDIGAKDTANGISINYDGGLIVSGSASGNLALVAYTVDGDIDSRFGGGDGIQRYTQTSVPGFPEPTRVKVVVTGSTTNPVRRIVAGGGNNGQAIRVVDVAPAITITALDAEASETVSNTATLRISRGNTSPNTLRVRLGVLGTAISPDDDRFTNNQDYNATAIVFGNGLTTPTFLDIPAGVSSVTVVITAVNDTLVEGDESVTFSIASNAAYDVGSPSSASIIIRDNEPPAVPFTVSKAFLCETLPQRATFTFSQNVGASLGIDDFVFSAGLTTPAFSYNSTLNTATLSWANPIADGNYNVRVKASGVTNAAGVHLNADSINSFGVLAGDPNRDGVANFDDLLILAQNYGQTGLTFSQGNIDYSADGLVGFDDLLLLAQRYGTSLAAPALVGPPPRAKKTTGRTPRIDL